jgi:hypothetical protein
MEKNPIGKGMRNIEGGRCCYFKCGQEKPL